MLRRRRACQFPAQKGHVPPRPREAPPLAGSAPHALSSGRATLPLSAGSSPASAGFRRVPLLPRPGEQGPAAAGGTERVEPRGVSAVPAGTGPGAELELGWDGEAEQGDFLIPRQPPLQASNPGSVPLGRVLLLPRIRELCHLDH